MSAPKRFPDWLRERVRQEVADATKPQPTKPQPAPKPVTAKPTPPKRAGVTITAYPDTASPTEVANRSLAPPPIRRTDTDAHDEADPTPCYTCGGPVRRRAATYWGPWRRHAACESVGGSDAARVQAAARKLGLGELSWTDAVLVASGCRVECYADHAAKVEPTWTTERLRDRVPWAHVDRKALRATVATLPSLRVAAGVAPSTCTDGRCAWCGCSTSAGWFSHGHAWPDGSPAPLCSTCSRVFVKHGEPSYPDDVRQALAECVTGVPPMMGNTPPTGLVPYVEVAVEDDGADVEPWSHLPADAVRSYRMETWSKFGLAFCPPEHRDEVQAWATERDRVRAERRRAEEVEAAERANVHGF